MKKLYHMTREEGRPVVLVNGEPLDPAKSLKVNNHSPTGFEWGYGGSGPSQLALGILLDYTDDKRFALKHYHNFKWKLIATAPAEGFDITSDEIEAFIKETQVAVGS